MKALVTGGGGFIGSHLVDCLLFNGHSVVVLDNFSTGRKQNLEQHKDEKRLQVFSTDVTDISVIEPHFKKIDWVFHLAALADIVPSVQNPLAYHRSNVNGTITVLELARKYGVQRFVYAASSSCYGIPEILPTPENAPIKPQYPYALTKNLAEEMVMHWGKVYRLPVISLRLFNVYGPRSRTSGTYGAVFGVFLSQKINKKPFTVVGDGHQTRDFTFVTDVVKAFISATTSKVKNEIFNVGSGTPVSINRLVELLEGDVTYIPKRPGEPDVTHADITKIKKMLRWKPKISFEEGVEILLKNIDHWKKAPLWTKESIAEATQDWFRYLSPQP